jgi:dipeptidase E
MKLYLSSHRLGNHPEKFVSLFINTPRVAVIANAKDELTSTDRQERVQAQIEELKLIGITGIGFDLRDFNNSEQVKEKLKEFNGLWILGGNTFLLRRAMRDSGFDLIIKDLLASDGFVYAGYSAGSVLTGQTMKGLELVDDIETARIVSKKEIIWEGLGILPYTIIPHYKSDHPEAILVDNVVEYLIKENIPYKTLRDGEVIIITESGEELVK